MEYCKNRRANRIPVEVTSHFTTAPLESKMMVLTEKSLQMALNEYLDGSGAGADRALAEAVDSQVTHLKEALKRVNRDSDAASQLEVRRGAGVHFSRDAPGFNLL